MAIVGINPNDGLIQILPDGTCKTVAPVPNMYGVAVRGCQLRARVRRIMGVIVWRSRTRIGVDVIAVSSLVRHGRRLRASKDFFVAEPLRARDTRDLL